MSMSVFRVKLPAMEKGTKYGRYDAAILVRMEKALRAEVERLSIEEDIPISTMARKLIRQALDERKSLEHLKRELGVNKGKAKKKPT